MVRIIDRRFDSKNKSAVNRHRFMRRFKQQIRKAVSEAIHGRSIRDLENGEQISIPARDLSEPSLQRTPLVFQAGASPRGIRFAARHAEAAATLDRAFAVGRDSDLLHEKIEPLLDRARVAFGRSTLLSVLAVAAVAGSPRACSGER